MTSDTFHSGDEFRFAVSVSGQDLVELLQFWVSAVVLLVQKHRNETNAILGGKTVTCMELWVSDCNQNGPCVTTTTGIWKGREESVSYWQWSYFGDWTHNFWFKGPKPQHLAIRPCCPVHLYFLLCWIRLHSVVNSHQLKIVNLDGTSCSIDISGILCMPLLLSTIVDHFAICSPTGSMWMQ